jgi:hypothetical protein
VEEVQLHTPNLCPLNRYRQEKRKRSVSLRADSRGGKPKKPRDRPCGRVSSSRQSSISSVGRFDNIRQLSLSLPRRHVWRLRLLTGTIKTKTGRPGTDAENQSPVSFSTNSSPGSQRSRSKLAQAASGSPKQLDCHQNQTSVVGQVYASFLASSNQPKTGLEIPTHGNDIEIVSRD